LFVAVESLGDLQAANEDYLNGLAIAESLKDKYFIAKGLINIGAIYYQTSQYEKSLAAFNEALTIANDLNDVELKSFIYNELGILYGYFGEEDKALEYYLRAYKLSKGAGFLTSAINSLLNAAGTYQDKENFTKAIDIYEKLIPDLATNQGFSFTVYSGLSRSYLSKEPPDINKSYQYLQKAEQYLKTIENPSIVINFYLDKADVLKRLNRFEQALASIEKAEKLIIEYKNNDYSFLSLSILGTKANVYRSLGRYKEAYQLATRYVNEVKKSLRERQSGKIQDIRIRYESEQAALRKKLLEKKSSNQALILLKAKADRQNQQTYFFLASLVTLIFAWLLVRLIKNQKKLLEISRIDSLTGLLNRRRFLQVAEQLFAQTKPGDQLSLLMIDVDNFKQINDNYGHACGDTVLKNLAKIISKQVRQGAIFARFGGEEFIILLPQVPLEQACETAERLRAAIENFSWQLPDNKTVSISIGLASYDGNQFENLDQLIKKADDLLYKAKQTGRNKVCYE
jgi:diguanylate cyclase (GGDEF)-like protein